MSNRASRESVKGNEESDVGSEEALVDRGFDRWLNRQLHRIYDPVLGEPVPDEMLRLLDQFGPKPQTPVEQEEDGKS
jgi:hypothetical protein